METVGLEYWILTSDAFGEWTLPVPELMRVGLGRLAEAGLTLEELRLLVRDNPMRLRAAMG